MEQTNRFLVRVLIVLVVSLCMVYPAWPNSDKDRKNAANSFAKEIQQAHFHKVYVADFLDPSGIRSEQGCFFSSVFSTNLTNIAQDFAVMNRIEAQKQLDELHISAQDFQQPEMLAKAATALGADTILVGSLSMSSKEARLSIVLRDVTSGKEVHSMEYREKLKPAFEASFPAGQSEDGHVYYFPDLDGVSQPKCILCPTPNYSDEIRKKGIQGTVVLSVTIDEKGTIKEVRVVSSPDDNLTNECLNILKTWRMQPSHGPDGKSVPIRTTIENNFRLLN